MNVKIKSNVIIEIIDVKTNKIIRIIKKHNIVVNNGFKMITSWLIGVKPIDDPDYNIDCRITDLAVGNDNTPVAISQTNLINEIARKTVYPTPDPGVSTVRIDDQTVEFHIIFDKTELNGQTIEEMGLFSSNQSTPFMVTRFLTGSLSKTSTVLFKIKYQFQIVNP